MSTLTLRVRLNRAQARFFHAVHAAKARTETVAIDFETAVRVGKTKALVWVVRDLCIDYPGIHVLLARYQKDHLDAQLRPEFYSEVPQALLGAWEAKEEYQVFRNGSRVYLRALKSSETPAKYGKFQGLTLAIVAIDQAEEVPSDYWQVLKARVSQSGFPHLILLAANPPGEDHWLAEEFPEDPSKMPAGHVLVQGAVYENADNLDPSYISGLERDYPLGHPLRRRMVDGKRAVGYLGKPIYGKVFRRGMHVMPVEMNPELPLLEAWDFGRAAVLWAQFPPGRRIYLAEMLGDRGEYLETFVPKALDLRARLFQNPLEIMSCCDPAGADRNSQGTRQTAVDTLNQLGVYPIWVTGANHPERRTFAIQQIAGHLSRLMPDGPAVAVSPRCHYLIDAFEAGYVYDNRAVGLGTSPAVIRPKKDGTFDHLANDLEYLELSFGGAAQISQKDQEKMRVRRLRESQRDVDPFDMRKRQIRTGRGGY